MVDQKLDVAGQPAMPLIRSTHIPLISWRSVLAGLAVTMFAYALLMLLGIGIGGLSLASVIQHEGKGDNALAIGSGVYFLTATIVALFAGGFFTGRVSQLITSRLGAAHGLVIASVFFTFVLIEIGAGIGAAGKGVASLVGAAGSAAADLSTNSDVQNVVNRAYTGRDLKSDPETVTKGLAVRLLRGDQTGARDYLAYQTGMSSAEADQRIQQAANDFKQAAKDAGDKSAKAISAAGWSLFVMMFLGGLASMIGGAFGVLAAFRKPLTTPETSGVGHFRPAWQ